MGDQCGKTTMLRQLSNFEISYSSFVMDCNHYTSCKHIYTYIKNKIVFSEYPKNLIMIDDINLPLEQSDISQVLRNVVDEKTMPNIELMGKINQNLKNPAILMTLSSFMTLEKSNSISKSLSRLIKKTQLIPLQNLSAK